MYKIDFVDVFIDVAEKEMKPKDFYELHREIVSEIVKLKKRLKNPVNLKNGNPLSQSTIQYFKNELTKHWQEINQFKIVRKWLIACGRLKANRKLEMSPEEDFINHALYKLRLYKCWYVREREEKKNSEYWKRKAELWKENAELTKAACDLEIEVERLKHQVGSYLPAPAPVKPKKKAISNNIGLKVLLGGKEEGGQ